MPRTVTVTFASPEMASRVAGLHQIRDAQRVATAGKHVELSTDALEALAELPEDHDGHFDGRSIVVGGIAYPVEGLVTDTPLRREWAPWLGPAADEMSDEQIEQLAAAAQVVDERWPDEPDYQEERTAALSAIVQVLIGDESLEKIAEQWRRARLAEIEARAALTGALAGMKAAGVSEVKLAERAGITRLTVRKHLGKGK